MNIDNKAYIEKKQLFEALDNFCPSYMTFNEKIECLFATRKVQYNEDGEKIENGISRDTLDHLKKEFLRLQVEHKESNKRHSAKTRILNRINKMESIHFLTITFDNDALEKDCLRNVKLAFNKLEITNYVLITDYGKKNERLHLHGFCSLPPSLSFDKTKANSKKYPQAFAIDKISDLFGFNLFTPLDLHDSKESLSYCLKYTLKGEFKHKVIASRLSKDKKEIDLPF